jgi:hypothetical protein
MNPTRTIRRPAGEHPRNRTQAAAPIVIQLADGPITLNLRQLELLLFFADQLPNPPRRIVPSNYRALEDQGLIEQYTRSFCGNDSLVYRITERGQTASALVDMTQLSPHVR